MCEVLFTDDWLCQMCVNQKMMGGLAEPPDRLWEYHRGLLWHILLFMVGQAAERQGNGWLLHAIWKISMPLFEMKKHPELLQQGYSYLSGNFCDG